MKKILGVWGLSTIEFSSIANALKTSFSIEENKRVQLYANQMHFYRHTSNIYWCFSLVFFSLLYLVKVYKTNIIFVWLFEGKHTHFWHFATVFGLFWKNQFCCILAKEIIKNFDYNNNYGYFFIILTTARTTDNFRHIFIKMWQFMEFF